MNLAQKARGCEGLTTACTLTGYILRLLASSWKIVVFKILTVFLVPAAVR